MDAPNSKPGPSRRQCTCYLGYRLPAVDFNDVATVDDLGRFICANCHRYIHHETVARIRREQRNQETHPHDWGGCTVCRDWLKRSVVT